VNGYDRIVSRLDAAGASIAEVVPADPEAEAAIWQMHQDEPDWGPRTVADELAQRGVCVSYGQVRAVLG
jgi:hypothetical protein